MAVTLAALGVVAQGVGLLAAIRFVPRFRIAFEDLGAPLTVLSEMIQRYWPSAAFLAVSVLVLGLALWGSRRVLIGVAVVAVLLPIVHAVILVAALYLPLLEVVETLGT